MIKRVNLIESQPFSFTYLTLVQAGLGVMVLMALMVGYQFGMAYFKNKELTQATAQLETLKKERDKLKSKPVKERVSIGELQVLFDKMEIAPQWSRILNDISLRLPNSVWITGFKSLDAAPKGGLIEGPKKKGAAAQAKKDEKNKDPEKPVEMVHKLEFTGQSNDVRNLSEFLASLSHSDYVRNLTLSESEKGKTGSYKFVIKSEARTDAR